MDTITVMDLLMALAKHADDPGLAQWARERLTDGRFASEFASHVSRLDSRKEADRRRALELLLVAYGEDEVDRLREAIRSGSDRDLTDHCERLAQFGAAGRAVMPLAERMAKSHSFEAKWALERLRAQGVDVAGALVAALSRGTQYERRAAAAARAEYREERVVSALIEALADRREAALQVERALEDSVRQQGVSYTTEGRAQVLSGATDVQEHVRAAAALALAGMPWDPQLLHVLWSALRDEVSRSGPEGDRYSPHATMLAAALVLGIDGWGKPAVDTLEAEAAGAGAEEARELLTTVRRLPGEEA